MKQEGEAVKREPGLGANGGAPVIKKIKLSTGKAGAAAAPALKKPIIKFKPPPKQPRDAAAAAAVGAAAAPAALPIVRLTVTAGAGLGGCGGGGAKRPKVKGAKVKAGGGGGFAGKKGKPKAGKAVEPAPRGRPKRARSEMKDRCAASGGRAGCAARQRGRCKAVTAYTQPAEGLVGWRSIWVGAAAWQAGRGLHAGEAGVAGLHSLQGWAARGIADRANGDLQQVVEARRGRAAARASGRRCLMRLRCLAGGGHGMAGPQPSTRRC